MMWALLEILVPLLIALGLGVLVGWLLFRWRRRLLHAHEWNQLSMNARDAEAEAASARAAYEEGKNDHAVLAARLDATVTELESAQIELEGASRSTELLSRDIEARDAVLATLHTDLDASQTRASSLEADLNDAKTSITELARLEGDTDELRSELSASEERLAELGDLEEQLDSVNAELSRTQAELSSTDNRIKDLESEATASALASAELTETSTRVTDLESALAASRGELDASQRRIADLDARLSTSTADIEAAHARVRELEADLIDAKTSVEEDGGTGAMPSPLAFVATEQAQWRSGQTELGTAGADHTDDLKVIRGIGPRMEELLNRFGITSWEQLANLDESEVATVDAALKEFPGRIERDEWVAQAKELVEQFPDITKRPARATYLNRSKDDDPNT